MDNLKAFLAQNVTKVEPVKYAATDRINVDNKPVEWTITPITAGENEQLLKSCKRRINNKGIISIDTDTDKYACLLAVRCTTYPDLNNAELQNSYGVMGADNLLKTMLSAGEYTNYILKVQEVNGFDTDDNVLIEDAKN